MTIQKPGRGRISVPRELFSFAPYFEDVSPQFFKRLYGMFRTTFMNLAERLATTDETKFRRSSPLQRLSVTLRWLAGGSYLDIGMAHNLSTSTVYYFIHNTLIAINNVLEIKFPYNNEEWLLDNYR